MFFGFRIILQD